MSMVIYNNTAALTSQRYLNQTGSALSKNLEKLSSGLRINSAADDASGLAISEKLRGQISGLKRASMNAQDGVSLLQTAEGGLSTMTDMVQRMRELAVQAGNGIYTSNDRQEIQKEVDQLKDEIDRVSSSTEFNTKKLLNGDATALWSTDKSDTINAVVSGPAAEGNYNLAIDVDPGKNYVYKSDVMTLNADAIGAEITTAGGSINSSNVTMVTDVKGMAATGSDYYNVAVTDGTHTVDEVADVVGSYQQDGSSFVASFDPNVDNYNIAYSSLSSTFDGGYLEVNFDDNISTTSTGTFDIKARYVEARTGETGDWQTIADGASMGASGQVTVDTAAGGYSFVTPEGTSLGMTFSVDLGSSGNIQSGDKVLLTTTNGAAMATTGSGSGAIQITGGPTGQSGPIIFYTAAHSLTVADNGDNVIDYNNVTVYHASMDASTGNLNLGSMTLNFKETASGNTTFDSKFQVDVRGGGDAATTTTKLSDIARFTTDDGRNLFDNTQSLTVYGNGTSSTIYLEGSDTLADFENKLTGAIVNGLDMGADSSTSSAVSNVNNNLVNYVSTATDSSNEAVNGTFVIQTAMLGDNSQLSFVGDQSLIDGLSLATIQKGENSEVTVNVTDAHTGETVGKDKVNDYTLRNVISGMDVKIDSRAGLDISWDDTSKEMDFNAGSTENVKLHIVDNAMNMQVGANEGQTVSTSIAQADTKSLGLDNVLVVDQENAQKSITTIDNALDKISSMRATIGAQINRLDYTTTGLDTTRENLTASESRIRDLDFASEMTDFTRNQILNQAGTAMLSQANSLPQMALQLLG